MCQLGRKHSTAALLVLGALTATSVADARPFAPAAAEAHVLPRKHGVETRPKTSKRRRTRGRPNLIRPIRNGAAPWRGSGRGLRMTPRVAGGTGPTAPDSSSDAPTAGPD